MVLLYQRNLRIRLQASLSMGNQHSLGMKMMLNDIQKINVLPNTFADEIKKMKALVEELTETRQQMTLDQEMMREHMIKEQEMMKQQML
ncbi:hypothetical protein QN277_010450 [Acacia crassicarpa]|uniref:Uncharacterized protein n=1 Tax=Acacia crassicarpa TaxID=499986 RepID=A0AAE1M5J3_9FABA|nr:hypothetical protein QN277_010450 [Acacia crassicarpa]